MKKEKKQNNTKKERVLKGKILEGIVVSNSCDKTVVIKVTSKRPHPLYRKLVKKVKKYKAHTEKKYKIGEKVQIKQSRPFSKDKNWVVL